MAEMAMMAASIASGLLSGMAKGAETKAQNSAAIRQQEARDETASRQVEELHRQQGRADDIAAEEKSDVAHEYDLALGSLIASAADGGVTQLALARAVGAEGAMAALDIARIEGNRSEGQSQRRAESISIMSENSAQGAQTKANVADNTMSLYANTAGSLLKADWDFGSATASPPPPAPTPKFKFSGPQAGEGFYPSSGSPGF
jgi:hypothetical protein